MAVRFAYSSSRRRAIPSAAFAMLALSAATATPAFADAIDGDWCSGDGRHMTITGPSITTPGGHRIDGRYSRHFFSYVVPAGETGAGETVDVVLRGEYLAQSQQGGLSDGPVTTWRRCQAGVS
jgi:hypothetical protein